jgi:hypothetical protein
MDDWVVQSGSAQHDCQNGHKYHNDDARSHRELPPTLECRFAAKPPGDVRCQQTGNDKKYEKKQNHIHPYGKYQSETLFPIVDRTDYTLSIKFQTPIGSGGF